MSISKIAQDLMFDYSGLTQDQIIDLCRALPNKVIRWLGVHHPDNKTRKIFFQLTGIEIGEETVINENFVVSDNYEPLLKIGKRVSIAPNVTVVCEANPNNSILRDNSYVNSELIVDEQVVIEDDVWIGTNVTILQGVTIGRASVVGAGSVVTKNVPAQSIVAGVPAKVIRSLGDI